MNKKKLLGEIILALEAVHENAVDATKLAHETATNSETVAENKYDTFGLEASYLAHGQAKRVEECDADLATYKKLNAKDYSKDSSISIGALIYLTDESTIKDKDEMILFLGPAAGGLKLNFCGKPILIVTPSAPLGKKLIGHYIGDEIELAIARQKKVYEITAVY